MGQPDLNRRGFMLGTGAVLLAGAILPTIADAKEKSLPEAHPREDEAFATVKKHTVAANPADVPPPIKRAYAIHHDVELEARQVEAELSDGTTFHFMTWNGQVPGPMIRVRQGDTVSLTIKSSKSNNRPHNLDMHAIYATGGGSTATFVLPGQSKTEKFKCMYPGAFIYHCAVPNMDAHISSGMFGMILVEPYEGLQQVDREFYFGQHEIYTKQPFGKNGLATFDYDAMTREEPNYVVFNGAVNGITSDWLGPAVAHVGEKIRVFMVCGGPNLTSSFHAIGNVWSRCWPQGAIANEPIKYVQTQSVPPGSCFVGEMDLPVKETIKLVDHALSRVVRKGLLAEIKVV